MLVCVYVCEYVYVCVNECVCQIMFEIYTIIEKFIIFYTSKWSFLRKRNPYGKDLLCGIYYYKVNIQCFKFIQEVLARNTWILQNERMFRWIIHDSLPLHMSKMYAVKICNGMTVPIHIITQNG